MQDKRLLSKKDLLLAIGKTTSDAEAACVHNNFALAYWIYKFQDETPLAHYLSIVPLINPKTTDLFRTNLENKHPIINDINSEHNFHLPLNLIKNSNPEPTFYGSFNYNFMEQILRFKDYLGNSSFYARTSKKEPLLMRINSDQTISRVISDNKYPITECNSESFIEQIKSIFSNLYNLFMQLVSIVKKLIAFIMSPVHTYYYRKTYRILTGKDAGTKIMESINRKKVLLEELYNELKLGNNLNRIKELSSRVYDLFVPGKTFFKDAAKNRFFSLLINLLDLNEEELVNAKELGYSTELKPQVDAAKKICYYSSVSSPRPSPEP